MVSNPISIILKYYFLVWSPGKNIFILKWVTMRALWFMQTSLEAGASWWTGWPLWDFAGKWQYNLENLFSSHLSARLLWRHRLSPSRYSFFPVETISSNYQGLLFPSSLWRLLVFFLSTIGFWWFHSGATWLSKLFAIFACKDYNCF